MLTDLLIKLALAGVVLFAVLNLAGIQTWVERKQSAVMQDRIGANRAYFTLPWGWAAPINWFLRKLGGLGLLHPIADVIKLLTKEDFVPAQGNRFLHTLAPWVSVFFALVTFAAIPFGDSIRVGGHLINLQVASLPGGLLYVLALASIGTYGVILAGLASGNNLAAMGGLRAASQMLAYEIALGVSLVGVIMWYGSLDLQEIVRRQGEWSLAGGWLPQWGVLVQPLGCLVFMTAALAQTKRVPFDLPEGESEIIGYFVEYSGMKFGLFFLTDFVETVLVAALTSVLFFGGWQVPYLHPDGFVFPWGGMISIASNTVALLGVAAFTAKIVFFLWLFMAIRWTLPRFRYDQLMGLGWKGLFPLALGNIAVTAAVVLLVNR
ncbi:MAG: NADH-quinone oxidoreductase subunit H [Candidatus Omnitrophica bacterium]|nr:NADH-quinone oxidoreductase subunit H [Candidatus Omnitrophota bacterium]